jgi:hypothetical protein
MAATIFKYLTYLSLVAGLAVSFWSLRAGALCFLFSIACAHLASTARADKHAEHIHETLFIVLSILGQVNKKLDDASAERAATSAPRVGASDNGDNKVQRLPTAQGSSAAPKFPR